MHAGDINCRAMLCISAAYAVMWCLSVRLSVCLSVRLSRSWIMSKRINISSKFFHHHHSSFSIPNGVAIFRREPSNRGVEYRWGIGRNRDSGLRLLDVRSDKTLSDDKAEYMTQSAMHHWLSIDCWTCELRSDRNSYRCPCSVDRTVGDAPANVCL